MDEIRQKIEEFESQLIPKPTLLKESLLNNPALLPVIGLIVGLVLQFYFKLPLLAYLIILTVCVVLQIIQMLLKKVSINLTFVIIFLCFLSLGSIRLIKYNALGLNDIRSIAAEDFTFAHIKAQIIRKPVIVIADANDWLFSRFSQSLPYTTFYAKVTGIKTTEGWTDASGKIKFYISEDMNNLKLGNEFGAFCRLQKFYPPDNPGQFDTAQYMNRNSVYISASVKSADAITVNNEKEISKSLFSKIKAKLRRLATTALLDDAEPDDSAGLIEALLLGNRSKISSELYNAFIKTGLVHLVCLSGLHVGIIALLIREFAKRIFFWSEKRSLLHRGRAVAAIIMMTIFLLIVPARAPIIRAGIMFLILFAGTISERRSGLFNRLAIAAITILLIRPTDFLSPGFQLSFAAVSGIILFCPLFFNFLLTPFKNLKKNYLYTILQILLAAVSTGCTAWLATAPILAWHFYQFQPLTAIWTIPAVLLVAAILTLGVIKIILAFLLPTLALFLGFVITFLADILSHLVILFVKVPFSHVALGRPMIQLVLVFYILILLWRFFPLNRPARNLIYPAAIILLLVSALSVRHIRNSDDLRLTVLSVGHGQAVVGQLPRGNNIIIDAGSMSKNDPGNRIINPFLDYIAAEKIDSIFISHNDIDHYNGVPEILKRHKCANIYTTQQFIGSIPQSNTASLLNGFLEPKKLSLRSAPEKILFGETAITLLWPKSTSAEDVLSDNESSLVLLLEYADRKILFCSDITKDVQRQLVNSNPKLDIDVMLTPHHGSARTTDAAFLSHFKPEILITSCSAARFGGTSEEIKNFKQSYYTPKDGAVTILITPTGQIKVKTFRTAAF